MGRDCVVSLGWLLSPYQRVLLGSRASVTTGKGGFSQLPCDNWVSHFLKLDLWKESLKEGERKITEGLIGLLIGVREL